jgi:pilin isopeptide linkage protein
VRYDEHVETVTVNVNDVNHNGRLTCTVNYDGNGCVFTNSMREGSLLVSKDAIGATGSSQAFTFDVTLSAADGTPLANGTYALTGTGAVSGANVSVSGGTATLSCRGGETIGIQGLPSGTTYVVTERSLPGWTQTESVGTEGSIRPNAVSNVRFVNSYSAAGSFDVMGTKTMDGNAPDGMEFTFELREEDGSLVGIAKNDSTGAFAFEGLGIDPLWVGTTRTYTVTEVNDMQAGVYYDDSVRDVQVTFSDDGEGNLSGTVETPVGAPVSFANETASRRSPPVIEMPATGLAGIGGWHFLGLGAVAVALAEQVRRLRSGRTDEGDQDR